MSSTEQTSSSSTSSSSNLQRIIDAAFDVALKDYTKVTRIDLAKDPFVAKIELKNSPDDILELLQEQEKSFTEYRKGSRGLIDCLRPVVKILHASSPILGDAAGPVSVTRYHPVNLLL